MLVSADEKSQLQALSRRHQSLPAADGRIARVEFEYRRGGTLAYLGAYDVHRAQLMGAVAPTTSIVPFHDLLSRVMTTEPYASARRVFWIVDNGSSHVGQRSIDRMTQAWPTATLVHLPVHASWLNQIEIVFSIIQRKVIKPADFADRDALAERLLRSKTATTTRPARSPGPSPEPICRPCASGSTPTATCASRSPPWRREPSDHHRHGHTTALDQSQPRPKPQQPRPRRWPQLERVVVRFRRQFAYIDAQLISGEILPLCRLRYRGSASRWGFALYRPATRLPGQHPAQRATRRHP